MLHLIPAPLHRLGLRLAHGLRKRWWRVRKPHLSGAIVIAHDREGRVLLARHTYGSRVWTLPGGGLRRGENPAAGAAREFAEELGCGLGPLTPLGTYETTLHGAPCSMHVFAGEVAGVPRPDGREIAEARFFAVDALPPDVGRRVAAALGMSQQR